MYPYEAIKVINPELAWSFLRTLHGLKENEIKMACDNFIGTHDIRTKLQVITSGDQIEMILVYDKLIAKEMNISSVPSYLYRERLYTSDSAFKEVKREILKNRGEKI